MSKINKRNMKLPYKQYYKTLMEVFQTWHTLFSTYWKEKKNLIPTQSKNQDNVE